MDTVKKITKELRERLRPVRPGLLDIATVLRHFVMVTYSVAPDRLASHLPEGVFTPEILRINNRDRALVSAVFFIDEDFRFVRLPYPRFRFAQTNYRTYVRRVDNNKPAVWFFGTTLGGWPVHVARKLWRIPWHPGRYTTSMKGNPVRYQYRVESSWAPADIDIVDTGSPLRSAPGFPSSHHLELILTHPVEGFFRRLDGRLGTYSIRHPLMAMTHGRAQRLSIPLFSTLGLLDEDKQATPHSIAICPRVPFHILMPPVVMGGHVSLEQ